MGKNKKKKKCKKIDYGTAEFYCRHCDYKFELDWETICVIQECTHGNVGYHLNDTYISCSKCDEVCWDEETPEVKSPDKVISDGDLPF
ncbi:hypothetical protein ACWM35_21470 [Neobacillus sp. K501]